MRSKHEEGIHHIHPPLWSILWRAELLENAPIVSLQKSRKNRSATRHEAAQCEVLLASNQQATAQLILHRTSLPLLPLLLCIIMYGRRGGRGGYGNNNGGGREEPNEQGFFDGSDSILLRVQGVKGNSDVVGFEDCIPVMSFSWNMSKEAEQAKAPVRVRQVKANEKKRRFLAAGLTEDGNPPSPPQVKKEGLSDDEHAAALIAAAAKVALTSEEYVLRRETALDGYDSDDHTGVDFADSEATNPGIRKTRVGDFTCTKFNDVSSPQLYHLMLSQKKGVEIQIFLVQARAKKVDGDDSSASPAPAAAAATTTRANIFGGNGEEEPAQPELPPIPRETVVTQEWTLINATLSNVSISGGSGGRPVETLSIDFGSFQYRFVDWAAKQKAPALKKVPEHSIIYDHLRNQAKHYVEAVQKDST
jgi:type VI protein secretion system component Hcp